MSRRGAFMVDRGVFDHAMFDGDPFSKRDAWCWLIGEAAWTERRKRIGAANVTLQRGQLSASLRTLADKWQWSKSTVDRFLARLRAEGMIHTDLGTGALVITICNYERYQTSPSKRGTAVGHQTGHKRDTNWDAAAKANPQPELEFSAFNGAPRDTVETETGTPIRTHTNKGQIHEGDATASPARAGANGSCKQRFDQIEAECRRELGELAPQDLDFQRLIRDLTRAPPPV